MGEMRLLATVYHPSAEEAEEVLKYVLRETAKHAKIDPERIALKITKYQAITGKSFGDGYWRPDGGDLLIDGKEPDRSSRADMKIRWWCAQVMMATRRTLDPSKRGEVITAMK